MIEEYATDDGDRSDRKYRLIVRCIGLVVSPKTLTQGNGLFTNFMNMSTGNSNLKNEKRYIRMFQSETFHGKDFSG
jgi:S-adenosylmethionine hydrolase